ncbi:MAG: hypothetical protein GWO02_08235, partial [Gammaproteobacteria bacterium]|nr:hypothetical protein [Gammaproteobacteria bacterium]
MSAPPEGTDRRLQALLELLDERREQRCREILEEARTQARDIERRAFGEARERMHQAIEEERSGGRARVEQTRAQVETRARQRHHQAVLRVLHQAWEPLRRAVRARWDATDTRRRWVRMLLDEARERFPRDRDWEVRHPAGWPEDEQRALRAELEQELGGELRLVADETVAAGLRIRSDATELDGTPDGLLADRVAVEAGLLAHLAPAQRS